MATYIQGTSAEALIDPGNGDDIGSSVAKAESVILASYAEHEQQTHASGSIVGDLMPLPEGPDSESSELGSIA